jgi:hypothetical protein
MQRSHPTQLLNTPLTPNSSVILHSASFLEGWRSLLVELYGYKAAHGAMAVPGLLGGSTAVYLPLLNYSDITLQAAQTFRARWAQKPYQLRALDPQCTQFQADDTVTMRLDIAGLSAEQVFKQRVPSKCRNQIRKGEKSGLTVLEGRDGTAMRDFYRVFAATMHRHGTPVFTQRLFELLPRFVDARYLVAYHDGQAVACLCLVTDGPLAWVPWAGSAMSHRTLCPNHLLYWRAIQLAVAQGREVFDFGRSAYLGPTYGFKLDWGAQPVKIAILTDKPQNVYAKYAMASAVWQRLPRRLVGLLGPFLCRYLPDL